MLNTQNATVINANNNTVKNNVTAIISYSEGGEEQTPTIATLKNVWGNKEANINELVYKAIQYEDAENAVEFDLEEEYEIKVLTNSYYCVAVELTDNTLGLTTAITFVKQ